MFWKAEEKKAIDWVECWENFKRVGKIYDKRKKKKESQNRENK